MILQFASTSNLKMESYLSANRETASVIIQKHPDNLPISSDKIPEFVRAFSSRQVPPNTRRVLRNFIHVLEAQTYSPLRMELNKLEKFIILNCPPSDARGKRASSGMVLRPFVGFVADSFDKHMVLRTLFRVDGARPKSFTEPSLDPNLLFAQPNPTYGQSYRDYMSFVKRSQHLIAEGFQERDLISKLRVTGFDSTALNSIVMKTSKKTVLKDKLLHGSRLLERVFEQRDYALSPFHDWDPTHVNAIRESLYEQDYLAPPKHMNILDSLRSIGTHPSPQRELHPNPDSKPQIPHGVLNVGSVRSFYENFKDSDQTVLDRISRTLEVGVEAHQDLGPDSSKLFVEIIDKIFLHSVNVRQEEIETRVGNAIMFSLLANLLGEILESSIAKVFIDPKSRPGLSREQSVRYYWWILIRQPSNLNRMAGGSFTTLEVRSRHELGGAYKRYLEAVFQFKDMLEHPELYIGSARKREVSEASLVVTSQSNSPEHDTQPLRATGIAPTTIPEENSVFGSPSQNAHKRVLGSKRGAEVMSGSPTLEPDAHELPHKEPSTNSKPNSSHKFFLERFGAFQPLRSIVPPKDGPSGLYSKAIARTRRRLGLTEPGTSTSPPRTSDPEVNIFSSSSVQMASPAPPARQEGIIRATGGNIFRSHNPSWLPSYIYQLNPASSRPANIPTNGEALPGLWAKHSHYSSNAEPGSSAPKQTSGLKPNLRDTFQTPPTILPSRSQPTLNQVTSLPGRFEFQDLVLQRPTQLHPHRHYHQGNVPALSINTPPSSSHHRVVRLFGKDIPVPWTGESERVSTQQPGK